MLLIIGLTVVFGSIIGGYIPHGKIEVLWQPLEFVIIGGASIGGFIIANPKEIIGGVLRNLGKACKGAPYNKHSYLELLTLLYTLFRFASLKGPLELERHIENPTESSIFTNFPKFTDNEHARTFLCDYLRMITMGTNNPHEVEALIDEEVETHYAEQKRIADAVATMADGLPAFGIVAAVLGVITTMGSILEPPEVLGGMIGAALVGTFLGVLLAYGVVGPIGHMLNNYAEADTKYYACMKAALIAHMQGYAPVLSIEFARKMLFSNERPTFDEVEDAVSGAAEPTPA
ncbi:MAG: flagellar motor stator protein MotA [Alphaproteobacteria bacterium]